MVFKWIDYHSQRKRPSAHDQNRYEGSPALISQGRGKASLWPCGHCGQASQCCSTRRTVQIVLTIAQSSSRREIRQDTRPESKLCMTALLRTYPEQFPVVGVPFEIFLSCTSDFEMFVGKTYSFQHDFNLLLDHRRLWLKACCQLPRHFVDEVDMLHRLAIFHDSNNTRLTKFSFSLSADVQRTCESSLRSSSILIRVSLPSSTVSTRLATCWILMRAIGDVNAELK